MKELHEMTLRELWELFPISLVEPKAVWSEYYSEMETLLKDMLADCPVVRISHIGSTAIRGIRAKDIVDVLVEIAEGFDMDSAAAKLRQEGLIQMSASEKRISLNLGYTKYGFAEKVYHIHLRYAGDNDELYFRDYLNEFPEASQAYEALKLRLWQRFEKDRDAYTDAKRDFVREITGKAKALYGARY